MAGYCENSMSWNAIMAYDYGEKPMSKWSKNEIINKFIEYNNSIDEIYAINITLLKKLTLKELKRYALKYASWHHTSCKFNKTDFYEINCELTNEEIENVINSRVKKEKKKAEKPMYVTALVQFTYWSGSWKHPKKEEKEMIVNYMSNEKIVDCGFYGKKRLSSLYIIKKKVQKTKYATLKI